MVPVAEPLTIQVISPFAPQLIRDIGITNGKESRVGHYVGLLVRFNPPPVANEITDTLLPLFFVNTFGTLVLSRCLNGALNGNIGVIKSMMAEMTDSTNIAEAYAYMPIAWSTGGALGPVIGGFLSRPADQFPSLFGNNEFLKKYPYFVPSAVPASYAALIWLVAFLYLKDTHKAPMPISHLLTRTTHPSKDIVESQSLSVPDAEQPLPLRGLLTPKVLIAAGNYAFFAMLEVAFRSIQPLFLSTPIELGGLGLAPPAIGQILSAFGILNGVFQVLFFARIHDRFGSKKTFVAGVAMAFPEGARVECACVECGGDTDFALDRLESLVRYAAMSKPPFVDREIDLLQMKGAIFIFIAAAAPNRASLGATNGLSQTTVSLMRAVGPTAATSLFSLSIERDYMGGYLVYYVLLLAVCAGLYVASLLPKKL
ncbi:hypothetical protein DXG01_013413 [Tephrocybe rancida]|nr:hypothetical protein DXG01_013413 [Tephrocybe rancida]